MSTPLDLDDVATKIVFYYTRLGEEVAELKGALESDDRAAILDEVLDVTYFAYKIAAVYGVAGVMSKYRRFKSSLRRMAGKDKDVERAEAILLIAEHDFDVYQKAAVTTAGGRS